MLTPTEKFSNQVLLWGSRMRSSAIDGVIVPNQTDRCGQGLCDLDSLSRSRFKRGLCADADIHQID
eukprot:6145678-Lingulodinium_polyedra.AAC.1